MSTYRRRIAYTVNNGVAWKTPSCSCSCQLCIKSEICCGDGWKLRCVAGEACNMTENTLSILIVLFSVQLQQTEISERKLFIFQHGVTGLSSHLCKLSSRNSYSSGCPVSIQDAILELPWCGPSYDFWSLRE